MDFSELTYELKKTNEMFKEKKDKNFNKKMHIISLLPTW